MTQFALKRTVRLSEEALTSKTLFTKAASEARVMIITIVVERHLFATIETPFAL
jgi:hypothetical protein